MENASFDEIINAAKVASVHDFISSLPNQYDTIVEERGGNFSAGQRQRIMIARAVIRKPKIFILDEATAALDLETEKEVLENFFRVVVNSTVILISHQSTFKQYVDRIFKIEDSKIIEVL